MSTPLGSLPAVARNARFPPGRSSLQHLSVSQSFSGRRGLPHGRCNPLLLCPEIRLTTLSWKSGLRSEEVGRRAKAWMSSTGMRVTFPGVNLRKGADSGDISSSNSVLGYNLASWRKRAKAQGEGRRQTGSSRYIREGQMGRSPKPESPRALNQQ